MSTTLKVKLGETIHVEFQPSNDKTETISFAIDTIPLPKSKMALSVTLPQAYTYRYKEADGYCFVLLTEDTLVDPL